MLFRHFAVARRDPPTIPGQSIGRDASPSAAPSAHSLLSEDSELTTLAHRVCCADGPPRFEAHETPLPLHVKRIFVDMFDGIKPHVFATLPCNTALQMPV